MPDHECRDQEGVSCRRRVGQNDIWHRDSVWRERVVGSWHEKTKVTEPSNDRKMQEEKEESKATRKISQWTHHVAS